MSNKNFEIYFDCGSSKIRAGAFNKENKNDSFHYESKFFSDHTNIETEIQKIISYLEKDTNEYLNDVNLMIDDQKMLSIGVSISKKLDGSKLKQEDVQFLAQEAKQQILKYYKDQDIVHIIINNYRINDIQYTFLPDEIKCNLISIDILFICLPKEITTYFKKIFLRLDISIDKLICSSYAKSIYYKENFSFTKDISFIDIGFNKTSIIFYNKNKIIFFGTLSIGANHITKDISKILKVTLEQAENIKLNFHKDQSILKEKNYSLDLVQKIIFSRTEEILELCDGVIKLNLNKLDKYKMVLTGEGSKILDNPNKDKISYSKDIDLLEETMQDICQSGLRLKERLNRQEVVVIPKKLVKQGFFEKLFHFFK